MTLLRRPAFMCYCTCLVVCIPPLWPCTCRVRCVSVHTHVSAHVLLRACESFARACLPLLLINGTLFEKPSQSSREHPSPFMPTLRRSFYLCKYLSFDTRMWYLRKQMKVEAGDFDSDMKERQVDRHSHGHITLINGTLFEKAISILT